MEGSSNACKCHDDSSPSSGGEDPSNPSPFSIALASKRRQPPGGPLLKPGTAAAAGQTVFRLLCPFGKTGSVIGKGCSIVRLISEETGASVRIEDPIHGCDERVVVVSAETLLRRRWEEGTADSGEETTPAQRALVRVFEMIVRADEGEGAAEKEVQGTVMCRLLAPNNHVGCVLGKGGKIVERIRQESGAQIRIFAKEQVPICAAAGEELIQISGFFYAVKKALLSVASCLQDNTRTESTTFYIVKPYMGSLQGPVSHAPLDACAPRGYLLSPHGPDYHPRVPNPPLDNIATGHRNLPEEEVAFRILCPRDKVCSIIGKSGAIMQSLQSETGASIKIIDAVNDSDERIIFISAHEICELNFSPAQDAVLRVQSRLSEACIDKGSVPVRLLVPAQQIGCLIGKGGSIIAEMRRTTGANIKIFVNEQVPKCAQPNDEIVQVTGSFQSVREALLHITGRVRETIFAPKHYPNSGMPHPFRSRNDAPPPVRYPTGVFSHVVDPSAESPIVPSASSPRLWNQGGNSKGAVVVSAIQASVAQSKTVTVAVPRQYMGFVHGESDGNLALIREISGANVTIYDPKPGMLEGSIVILGTQKQTSTAQGLLHAFILNGL